MAENLSTAAGGPAGEPSDWEPGRTAFDAYSAAVGGVSVYGEQLPSWERLYPAVQEAWQHAAYAVLDQAGRGQSLIDPEQPNGEGVTR